MSASAGDRRNRRNRQNKRKKMIDNILLAPYYLTLKFRHFLYDHGIKKSSRADVPTVCIGNITVGGTGKTPHTELTVRTLLSMDKFRGKNIAVLSRGYRRESKGFQQVTTGSSAAFSGDEPLQIKNRFPGITVAVDAKRTEGCEFLSHPERLKASRKNRKCADKNFPAADIIILDDAFQHRALKPDLSILLIDYNRPVFQDRLLPLGHLRDIRERTSAADIIIITKCPSFIDSEEKEKWISALGIGNFDTDSLSGTNRQGRRQTILFSTIKYCDAVPIFHDADQRYLYARRAIMFSGIANDTPLRSYLAGKYKIAKHIKFGDHHKFTGSDIRTLESASQDEPTAILVTTEKDSQRLKDMGKIPGTLSARMFQVPIEAVFTSEKEDLIFRNHLKNLL